MGRGMILRSRRYIKVDRLRMKHFKALIIFDGTRYRIAFSSSSRPKVIKATERAGGMRTLALYLDNAK